MAVSQGPVPVPMGMRFSHRTLMVVLVMGIMYVAVLVLEFLMLVFVLVSLDQVEPYARRHQRTGERQFEGWGFRKHKQASNRAEKGSNGVIGARPRSSQMP